MTSAAPIILTAVLGAGAGSGIGAGIALRLGNRRAGASRPSDARGEIAGTPAHDAAAATYAAVEALAATSAQQAAAMSSLAQMTAHSMRSATGAYVFQLRDRFDEALPVVAIGVADHSWRAVADPVDGPSDGDRSAAGRPTDSEADRETNRETKSEADADGEIDAAALELVDQLVFHPGDRVRFIARFVVNQSPIRRTMTLRVTDAPDEAVVLAARCRSASRDGSADGFDVAPDVSTFVELPIDVEVGSLPHGSFALAVSGSFEVTNTRPEGSIAHLPFRVLLRGMVVPDDDGNGLDLLSVEAEVDPDRRTYWLDKTERVELTLPGPAPATPSPMPSPISSPMSGATPGPTTAVPAAVPVAGSRDPELVRIP